MTTIQAIALSQLLLSGVLASLLVLIYGELRKIRKQLELQATRNRVVYGVATPSDRIPPQGGSGVPRGPMEEIARTVADELRKTGASATFKAFGRSAR